MRTGEILCRDAKSYGNYVVKNRAFSEFCDGLKPAQRALLWSAFDLNMHKSREDIYSARIVGNATGKFHPHGDTVYEVLCRMTKEYLKFPYFDSESNFGDRLNKPGHARYTASKLSAYGKSFMYEDYLGTVPFKASYDGKNKVPLYLPALYPNLLINGTEGIGYGASARIPAFTIKSIQPLIKNALLGKPYSLNTLEFNFMYNPDILEVPDNYFDTGRGVLKFGPRYKVNADKTKYLLTHTSVLTLKNKSKLFGKLDSEPAIVQINDMSQDAHHLNIEFVLKGTPTERQAAISNINKTFSNSQSLITAWLEGPADNKFYQDDEDFEIKFMRGGLRNLIDGWADYRLAIEDMRLIALMEKVQKGLNYQELLLHAALNSAKIFKVLDSKNKYSSRKQLDDAMADALAIKYEEAHEITGLENYRLSSLERIEMEQKILELRDEISDLRGKRTNLESHTSSLVDTGLEGLLTA